MLLFFFFFVCICLYLTLGKFSLLSVLYCCLCYQQKKWTLAPVVTDPLCRRRGRERERRGETRRDDDDDAGVCKNLIEAVNN